MSFWSSFVCLALREACCSTPPTGLFPVWGPPSTGPGLIMQQQLFSCRLLHFNIWSIHYERSLVNYQINATTWQSLNGHTCHIPYVPWSYLVHYLRNRCGIIGAPIAPTNSSCWPTWLSPKTADKNQWSGLLACVAPLRSLGQCCYKMYYHTVPTEVNQLRKASVHTPLTCTLWHAPTISIGWFWLQWKRRTTEYIMNDRNTFGMIKI